MMLNNPQISTTGLT